MFLKNFFCYLSNNENYWYEIGFKKLRATRAIIVEGENNFLNLYYAYNSPTVCLYNPIEYSPTVCSYSPTKCYSIVYSYSPIKDPLWLWITLVFKFCKH